MRENLHDLRQALKGKNASTLWLDPVSAGGALCYHLRKLTRYPIQSYSLPQAQKLCQDYPPFLAEPFLLLDALATRPLKKQELASLAQFPQVFYSNVGHFETGPNYVDFLTGKARGKIAKLVHQAQAFHKHPSRPSLEAAVQQALAGYETENLKALNTLRQRQGRAPVQVLPHTHKAPSTRLEALAPFYEGPPLHDRNRKAEWGSHFTLPTLKFLTHPQGFQYYTPQRTLAGLQQLHDKLHSALKQKGIGPQQTWYVVPDAYCKSNSLLTYLYQQQTGVSPQRFITTSQLLVLAERRALGQQHALIFLDDLNGTSSTVYAQLREHQKAAAQVGHLFFANLVGSPAAEPNLTNLYQESAPREIKTPINLKNVHFVTAETYAPKISNPQHPFWKTLPVEEQAQFRKTLEDLRKQPDGLGFKDSEGIHGFYLSRPDNAIRLIQDLYRKSLDVASRNIIH